MTATLIGHNRVNASFWLEMPQVDKFELCNANADKVRPKSTKKKERCKYMTSTALLNDYDMVNYPKLYRFNLIYDRNDIV